MQHLSLLMLKPSLTDSFTAKYTASLEDIPANHSALPVVERGQMILDISGPGSDQESNSVNQTGVFSRMLRATCLAGSYKFCQTWKNWVTELRLEYSQRRKLARLTGGNGCSSWLTATSRDFKDGTAESCKNVPVNCLLGRAIHGLQDPDSNSTNGNRPECANWPTPNVPGDHSIGAISEWGGSGNHMRSDPANHKGKLNPRWVETLMGVPENWVKPDEESSNRIDELRMLGNGVVPQTVAKAFVTLINKKE